MHLYYTGNVNKSEKLFLKFVTHFSISDKTAELQCMYLQTVEYKT